MGKMICQDCGAIFSLSDARYVADRENYWGATVDIGGWYECPECGSTFIDDANECQICGEYCEDDICENCRQEVDLIVGAIRRRTAEFQEELAADLCGHNEMLYTWVRDEL